MPVENPVKTHSLLTEYDVFLFRSGKHYAIYKKLGSHVIEVDGQTGTYFAVYAPEAESVNVIGDFNEWSTELHPLFARWDDSGIWEGFIPGLNKGELYKYAITSKLADEILEKSDPFARYCEHRPSTASISWNEKFVWSDKNWMNSRHRKNSLEAAMSIYEIHLGSWKWHPTEQRPYTYRELAPILSDYLIELGFTHVEMMPVMEYPYDPSWGYQITGFFAPTSRYGSPDDFKYLINYLHKSGIGVILDWVPSHFPEDGHGLAKFDGSCVYEHPDPKRGYHPDWSSMIFDYGKPEVQSFLISNALFWLEQFHIDGLRVDAVASIIHLDYSRDEGQWDPNIHGGNENLEAIAFVQEFNRAVYAEYPDVITIAEESTSFEGVTKPSDAGGLGFKLKWMMGWMHDTLKYFKEDSLYRSYHHGTITFSAFYAFSENFMLPFSHDEVVHGKASLLGRMPGDEWVRFANLRAMYSYMFAHPGSKLLFMGAEIAQYQEWAFERELDWNLLQYPIHIGIYKLIAALNKLYTSTPALYQKSYDSTGFKWIDNTDFQRSVISFMRKGKYSKDDVVVICNFTPVIREKFVIGIPSRKTWEIIFNSDEMEFGGSGQLKTIDYTPTKAASNGHKYSLNIDLPPLAVLVLQKK